MSFARLSGDIFVEWNGQIYACSPHFEPKRFLMSGKRLDPWLMLMCGQSSLQEEGTLAVSDVKLRLRLPQPDGAALRRIGRRVHPSADHRGRRARCCNRRAAVSALPPSQEIAEPFCFVHGGAGSFVFLGYSPQRALLEHELAGTGSSLLSVFAD